MFFLPFDIFVITVVARFVAKIHGIVFVVNEKIFVFYPVTSVFVIVATSPLAA